MNTGLQIIPFLLILLIATKREGCPKGFLTNINSTIEILLVKAEKNTVDEKLDKKYTQNNH